jgi:hypothetical protein
LVDDHWAGEDNLVRLLLEVYMLIIEDYLGNRFVSRQHQAHGL